MSSFSRPQLPAGSDAYHRELLQVVFNEHGYSIPIDSIASWAEDRQCTRQEAQRLFEVFLSAGALVEHDPERLAGKVPCRAFYMIDASGVLRFVSAGINPTIPMLTERVQ
jgi:hypothetical protein